MNLNVSVMYVIRTSVSVVYVIRTGVSVMHVIRTSVNVNLLQGRVLPRSLRWQESSPVQ